MMKRIVKRSLLLILALMVAQMVSARALDKSRITVVMENATVKQFLDEVGRQTGIEFLYNTDEVKDLRVTVKETNAVARQVITKVMADIGCEIKENNGIVVVRLVKEGKSRHTVRGYVVDENKEPVIGAQVRIMGTKMNTVTNVNGEFYFDQTMPEKARVQITYIGMQTVHLPVKSNMVINMKSDTQMLEGVVVTGYQQLDRRHLTSSVTSKDMSELEIPGVADLSKMLEGKIPDLVSFSSSGEINATNRIRIRGTSTLIGNREPLWVLDGIILSDPVGLSPDVLNDPDYINRIGNAIAGINPQDILRIDVLKDAAATALYGTRAANGVIVVTTKSGREGKPTITYSGQFTFRKRPYYTDDKINLMNSVERIQFSQYLAEQHYIYPPNMPKVGYEQALSNLYLGIYDQQTFDEQVSRMQTMNTDWFDILCHNSFSHDHSVSVSGGSSKVRYYTSIGYTDQDDVINNTINRRYTAMAKIDFDLTKKLKVQFNLNGYLNNRQYAQSDNNPINYAYNTSRAIPAYNSDGSYTISNEEGADRLNTANLSHVNGTLGMSELYVILRALESSEDARTFSNPKIIVSSGRKATVDMTTKYPNVKISAKRTVNGDSNSLDLDMQMAEIPGEDKRMFAKESFFSWGISLDVTPRVSTNGLINIQIVPTISSQKDWVESGTASDSSAETISARYPVLDVQRLVTEFNMASGTTAVIGGLSRTVETQKDNGIPFLRNIWWIGPRLFGSKIRVKEQKEIIVFVTVGLIDPNRMKRDAGLPKNAVLGRQYVQGIKLEPGDKPQKNMEGVESLDLRPLDEQAKDPLATNQVERLSFVKRYMPFTKDPNYKRVDK